MVEPKIRLQRLLRPRGKDSFIRDLPQGARVFDIGCGNNSPQRVKTLRPDLYYVGIDVQDYAQSVQSIGMADEYRITTPDRFLDALAAERQTMDAVISSHNLEHCDDPDSVVRRMAESLRRGGTLYLAFPCEASLDFPRRRGSLSFKDDPTHKSPPRWHHVLELLRMSGMTINFATPRYRPILPALVGAALEPVSAMLGRVMPLGSTWALYGFESVIWARKMPDAPGL